MFDTGVVAMKATRTVSLPYTVTSQFSVYLSVGRVLSTFAQRGGTRRLPIVRQHQLSPCHRRHWLHAMRAPRAPRAPRLSTTA